MQNLCECVDTHVRKYTWPKLRGVAMCVCVRACEKKKDKFNSKAISWFLRKFAPSTGVHLGGGGGGTLLPLIKSRPPLEIASLQSASHVHRASPPPSFS